MWDDTKPCKLIKALERLDSFSLQHIIDADKFVEGEKLGYDLCGTYAPFCKVCSKWVDNPCVTAYRINERMSEVCPLLDATGLDDARIIQAVTDVDKYFASQDFGMDLCGRYAPFCAICDKTQPFPCGQAYLRLKAVEGFSTKALTAQEGGQLVINIPRWDDALTQVLEEAVSAEVETLPVVQNGGALAAASATTDQITATAPRRGFRIGTARRRRPQQPAENEKAD